MKENQITTTVTTSTTSLAQHESVGFVACSFEIDLDQPEKLVQLFPAGYFKSSQDGRPDNVPGGHWYIDSDVAAQVIAQRQTLTNDLLFDYEHQTLNAEANGKPAPAAGWGKNAALVWREDGLFIKDVQWTDAAAAAIRKKEYRYISPVFSYDKQTGKVIRLINVALTNQPAIDGMQDVIASLSEKFNQSTHSQPQTTESSMNEDLKWLLKLLGLNVDTDIDAAALKQQLNNPDAKLKLAALKAQVAAHGELKTKAQAQETEIAALKAGAPAATVDLTKFVPIETYQGLVTEVAALKAQSGADSVDALIAAAEQEGKLIVEAERSYLQSLGQQDMAALKMNLASRTGLAALKGENQTNGQKPPEKPARDPVAALTAEQKSVADQFGISHAELAKNLKGES